MTTSQSFWTGSSLSHSELMCLRSFIDLGHEVHLFSYSDNPSAPTGVKLIRAEEILPESAYFEAPAPSGARSPSAFSDLFRWTLLAQRGGWWIDNLQPTNIL